jgi:hypothetical protein
MTEVGVSPWQQLFERLVGELDRPTNPDWEAQTNTLNPKVYYDLGVLKPSTNNCFAAYHCVLATLTSSLNLVRSSRSTFAARLC